MITAVDCTIIRINPIIIKPEYLVYYTCSKTYLLEVESQSGGATRQRISRKNLSQITIPIPPLPEQQRIVDILDEAFAGIDTAIANTQQAISNAQELFDTELNRIFSQRGEGWEVKRLSDLGTITSSKRIFKNEYVPEGVPFFRTKEIKELANAETITTELFISKKRYDDIKLSFGVPNAGDILLTAIGTIGEIWVVESNKKFYFKDGNVLWLKNFTSINPYFLKYALIAFIEQIKSKANGSAYNALSIQQLNAHTIFMPSLEFQVNIVAKLDSLKDQTQALTDAYQRKLAALQELKQSLLHKAFTGELTANWQASSGC
jgi:type I restriction enzyme S subunit